MPIAETAVFRDRSNMGESQKATEDIPAVEVLTLDDDDDSAKAPKDLAVDELFAHDLLRDVASIVHHEEVDRTLEQLAEEAFDELGDNVYEKDRVKLSKSDIDLKTVQSSMKKGGTRILQFTPDTYSGLPVNQSNVYPEKKRTLADFREIISRIAVPEERYWIVEDKLCKKLGVKNKIHPLMMVRKSGNSSSAKREAPSDGTPKKPHVLSSSDDDDRPLEDIRRSLTAAHPSAMLRKSLGTSVTKKTKVPKVKAEKPAKVKKEPKAKKEPKEKKPKKEKPEKKLKSLKNFLHSQGSSQGSSTTGSPFLTPAQRSEKRFNDIMKKLRAVFDQGPKEKFLLFVNKTASSLTTEQIESVPEELIRYFLSRVHKGSIKKKEEQEGEDEAKALGKQTEKIRAAAMNSALSDHFEEMSEDLNICTDRLELPDEPVSDQTAFAEALTLTEAIHGLANFFGVKEAPSAESLFSDLSRGFVGFSNGLAKIVHPLIRLLQTAKEFKISHFSQSLRHYNVDTLVLSEMCRAILTSSSIAIEGDDDVARATEDVDLDMTAHDQNYRETLLASFPDNLELWELPPETQLKIASYLLRIVLTTELYEEYCTNGGDVENTKKLLGKLEQQKEKLVKLRKDLAALPECPPEDAELSRLESMKFSKIRQQRDTLRRNIAIKEEDIDELKEEIQESKQQAQYAYRISSFGMDRNFRRYYYFGKSSPNLGIWIQDLGVTREEVLLKQDKEPELAFDLKEKWYCLRDVEEMRQFSKKLNPLANREKILRQDFEDLVESVNEQKAHYARRRQGDRNSRSVSVDQVETALETFKASLDSFADEMIENHLAVALDAASYQARLRTATDVDTFGELLVEIVEKANPKAIRTTIAQVFGCGWFVLAKWRPQVLESKTFSKLSMLLDMVHSRADWDESLKNKKCRGCGRKNMHDSKVICHTCGACFHVYCLPRKLKEVPNDAWNCASCVYEKNKSEKSSRHQADAQDDQEDDNDDFFAAEKNGRLRKRAHSEASEDIPAGRSTRSKQPRRVELNPEAELVKEVFEKMKGRRVYTSLANLEIPRPTRSRKSPFMSLQKISDRVESFDFETFDEFKGYILKLLDLATEQLPDRKLAQLDEVRELFNDAEEDEEDEEDEEGGEESTDAEESEEEAE